MKSLKNMVYFAYAIICNINQTFHKGIFMSKKQILAIITVTLSFSLTMIDISIVALALPSINKELNFSTLSIQWVINAYLLIMAAFGLIGGKLSDMYQPKNVIITGLILFLLSSLGAFSSVNSYELVFFRAIQGFSCVFLAAPGLKLLVEIFPKETVGKAMGIATGTAAIVLTFAPTLGGIIVEYLSWRYIFLINVPICLIAIACLFGTKEHEIKTTKHPLDIKGFISIVIALFCLVFNIMESKSLGYDSVIIISLFIIFIISLISFIYIEKNTSHPLIDFKILANHKFILSVIIAVLAQMQLISLVYWVMYFQNALLYNPAETGILFLPVYILLGVVGIFSGSIIQKIGPYKTLIFSITILLITYLISLFLMPNKTYLSMLPALIGIGIAGTLLTNPLKLLVLESVPKEHTGIALGTMKNLQQISSTISLAILGAVISHYSLGATDIINAAYFGFYNVMIILTIVAFITAFIIYYLNFIKIKYSI